jgi:hypothetical protein
VAARLESDEVARGFVTRLKLELSTVQVRPHRRPPPLLSRSRLRA